MKVVIHPAYINLKDFIQRLPSVFEEEGQLLYKKRNIVKRYNVNGLSLVVKKFKHPNIIQRIIYTFFKRSKAERAYRFTAQLRSLQIDSPHEVAYIETKSHHLFARGYFVSIYCDDPTSGSLMKSNSDNTPLIEALATFLANMHEKGFLHGDLNLNNILYRREDNGQFHFTLIDINRATFKKPTTAECLNDLKRLTHERDVLRHLISLYAEKRHWDNDSSVVRVIRLLDKFENRRRVKRKFQDLIGIRHAE